MNTDFYKQAEQFVIDSYQKIGKPQGIKHFLRTVYWMKELYPQADEAMQIAAVTHDIERAFRKNDVIEKIKNLGYASVEMLRPHEERGAEIIATFLQEQGADSKLIDKVKMLVSRHEEGGNNEQNILKDADSMSYFENQIDHFLTVNIKKDGKEKIKQKFDWMFDRITSEKAKQIARPMYEQAIERLNSYQEI